MCSKKLISILTPCYNEKENIVDVYLEIKKVFEKLPRYRYEHIFIDNASTDGTTQVLRDLAKNDENVKVIINIKNFGHIRSPYYALMQTNGEAVINFYANLKEPADLIFEFIKKWEEGFQIVIGIKNKSQENQLMFLMRNMYYKIIKTISETDHINNFIGYGLYDKHFIYILKKLKYNIY